LGASVLAGVVDSGFSPEGDSAGGAAPDEVSEESAGFSSPFVDPAHVWIGSGFSSPDFFEGGGEERRRASASRRARRSRITSPMSRITSGLDRVDETEVPALWPAGLMTEIEANALLLVYEGALTTTVTRIAPAVFPAVRLNHATPLASVVAEAGETVLPVPAESERVTVAADTGFELVALITTTLSGVTLPVQRTAEDGVIVAERGVLPGGAMMGLTETSTTAAAEVFA
jgi:hypothetical protein